MKKSARTFLLTLMLLVVAAVPAWAFSDTAGDANSAKIEALQASGILSGEPGGTFNPQGSLTFSAGVSALVKGFDLSLAAFTFNQAPQASDSFPNLQDNAWYSDAFVIAAVNGLDIPKEVKPGDVISRELFAHLLSQAVALSGNFPVILKYTEIKDGEAIAPAYANSIQHLLNIGVPLLDKDGRFDPKTAVTRSAAAGWLYDATQYVQTMKEQENGNGNGNGDPSQGRDPLTGYSLSTAKISDKISEVTIKAVAPTPGYALKVASIVFEGNRAVIYTAVSAPDPEAILPQVLTDVTTTAYIPDGFTAVLANSGSNSAPGGAGSSGSAGSSDSASSSGSAGLSDSASSSSSASSSGSSTGSSGNASSTGF